ncbi:hypothetical protein [Microbacterium sp. 2MCAF23]|uniref:hypothetical protein n=1 Tax=Microbacterium sp. 2MCAF23 TaxID=3232985 RepID=UPI003F99C7FB
MVNDVLELAPELRSRQALLCAGWTDRDLASAVRDRTLHQLRRGWYVDVGVWKVMWPEQRHLIEVVAAAREARGPIVMSHVSAAVLWGLPLYRMAPDRVHITSSVPQRASSNVRVERHVAPLGSFDTSVISGIRCTSLSRTVFDLARSMPLEAAVSAADAAERMMALRGRERDLDAVESWQAGLAQRLEEAAGARGIRQARWVADFADGRAQLPGESVSRLRLHRLGFAAPRLQVGVPAPDGQMYFVDFGLDDVRAFGEFDGETKYRDEAMRSGRSIEDVLLAEKQREDWIRGRTQRRMARWGSSHIRTDEGLARRLGSFGICPP